MNVANKLHKVWIDKEFSKVQLGSLMGIQYSQICRIEYNVALTTALMLNRNANILDMNSYYLIYFTNEKFADDNLKDLELLNQLKYLELINKSDKNEIKISLDAFKTKKHKQYLTLYIKSNNECN